MSDQKDLYNKAELEKRATASTIRRIAGDAKMDIAYHEDTKSRPYIINKSITLPPPEMDKKTGDVTAEYRGLADHLALKYKYHDVTLHRDKRPKNNQAGAIFDALEQCRYDTIGQQKMAGIADNLRQWQEQSCVAQEYQNVETQADAPLHEALRFYIQERLTNIPAPNSAQTIIAPWQTQFEKRISDERLTNMQAHLTSQRDFTRDIWQLLEDFNFQLPKADPQESMPPTEEQDQDTDEETGQNPDTEQDQDDDKGEDDQQEQEKQDSVDANEANQELGQRQEDQQGQDHGAQQSSETDIAEHLQSFADAHGGNTHYHIYTDAHDETVKAEELSRPQELARLRRMLDKQMAHLQPTITRLANKLQRKLMAQQNRHWKFDQEEGVLDSARLARVIANPQYGLSYKQESDTEFKDTIVTLLLDNSGSMRGRPITMTAICADVLARTLERCGVKVEILGFTTRAWKGGASRDQWLRDGKPAQPGRLNDMRHIIYKNADTPWRHSRDHLGLMLREGILKENIDGEALLWAQHRLSHRSEQRKIMMVISDGAPVDDSTLSANFGLYLDQHLHMVIDWLENKTPTELVAIGIGHDVTRYYKRAVTITDVDDLGGAMIEKLAELFDTVQK